MARGPAQVHLLHGDDAYAMSEARKRLEAAVLDPTWREFNLTVFGPDASPNQVLGALQTMPFGAGGRLVVVKDAPWLAGKVEEAGVEALEQALSQQPVGWAPQAHLLLLATKADKRLKLIKAIAAAGQVTELSEVKPWQVEERLGPWVHELAGSLGRRITPDAVSALLLATGADRRRIHSELEKLAAGAPDAAPITAGLVQELVQQHDVAIFALTDALARRRAGDALVALQALLVTEHPLKVVSAAATILRGWARLKQLQERGLRPEQIARELGANSDFKVRKDLGLLTAWRAVELDAALDALLGVDLAIKAGRWPPEAHGVLLTRAVAAMLTSSGARPG
ncbi:MAG: DNA polymerase III subunit delta [Candidatus Sericytochromatia bacterium]|nr:DNA polymerase III subunit delta [Candidatus Sericytochromatia bacterium]